MDIADRVVVITGASSGIGEATARLAHSRGAHVVLAARRADRLADLEKQLPGAVVVTADVTKAADRQKIVDAAGHVDVLINNAGRGLNQRIEQIDPDDYAALLDLNVGAALAMMQAVVPSMRARGAGAIVNISSGTSTRVMPGVGAYAATKAALNMLSAVAREELADDGIVVSTVSPRITTSEFHTSLQAGDGMRRPGRPMDTSENVAEEILRVVGTGEAYFELPAPGAR